MEVTTVASAEDKVTAEPAVRLSGASSYAVLSAASLSVNVVLAIILLKNHRQYRRMTFFVITWQLLLADMLTQLIQLVIAVPITYAGFPLYGDGLWLHCVTSIETLAYYATLFFSFLMTANRVMVFLLPRVNQFLFAAPNLYRTIVMWWLVLLVAPVSLNAAGCYKKFETNGYYLYYDCQTPTSKEVYALWYNITTYTPVVMIVMYAIVFCYLRYASSQYRFTVHADGQASTSSNQEKSQRRREHRLLVQVLLSFLEPTLCNVTFYFLQSFLICGSLEVQNLAFNYLPLLGASGQWAYAVNFVANWIGILNNSMTAIVMVAFNNDIREQLAKILGMRTRAFSKATTVLRVHTLTGSCGSFGSSRASLPAA